MIAMAFETREQKWKSLGMTCRDDSWFDEKNRLLLCKKDNSFVLSRVPDLNEEIKQEIARFFSFNTKTPLKSVYQFLNYAEIEEEFCS